MVTSSLKGLESLVADPQRMASGQACARPECWLQYGCDGDTVWGRYEGSAAQPYRVVLARDGTRFFCDCPSRQFPCKHVTGLALMFLERSACFPSAESGWGDLLQERGVTPARATRSKPKNQDRRREGILAGLEELELWMGDLIRAGLASLHEKPESFWQDQAARLVDARAPGLAERLLAMSRLIAQKGDWPEQVLAELGRLRLFIEAFRRFPSLSPEVRADLRVFCGWAMNREEVPDAGESVRDQWLVLGVREDRVPNNLLTRRTWCFGLTSGREALIQEFTPRGRPFDAPFPIGACFKRALVFYPGSVPLRVLTIRPELDEVTTSFPTTVPSWEAAHARRASILARNPFFDGLPVVLEGVSIRRDQDTLFLRDRDRRELSLDERFRRLWDLVALGASHPLTLFGEWHRSGFLPFTVALENRLVRLDEEGF